MRVSYVCQDAFTWLEEEAGWLEGGGGGGAGRANARTQRRNATGKEAKIDLPGRVPRRYAFYSFLLLFSPPPPTPFPAKLRSVFHGAGKTDEG